MLLDVAVKLHVLIFGPHPDRIHQVEGHVADARFFASFANLLQCGLHVLLLQVPIDVTLEPLVVELFKSLEDWLEDIL